MSIFSDSDLQDFSDLAQDLGMKDTADILRNNPTTDEGGGSGPDNYEPAFSSPCMVIDAVIRAEERAVADQYINSVVKKVIFPRLTDVRSDDRIVWKSDTYEVVGLFDPTTFEAIRRVMISREVS